MDVLSSQAVRQTGRQDAPQDQKRGTGKRPSESVVAKGSSYKTLDVNSLHALLTPMGVSNLSRIPPTVLSPGARYLASFPSLRVPGFLFRIGRLHVMYTKRQRPLLLRLSHRHRTLQLLVQKHLRMISPFRPRRLYVHVAAHMFEFVPVLRNVGNPPANRGIALSGLVHVYPIPRPRRLCNMTRAGIDGAHC
jgi:hypothetical protein